MATPSSNCPTVRTGHSCRTEASCLRQKLPPVGISSIGGARPVGVDDTLQKNLYLNLDVKKIYINSAVALNGTAAKPGLLCGAARSGLRGALECRALKA